MNIKSEDFPSNIILHIGHSPIRLIPGFLPGLLVILGSLFIIIIINLINIIKKLKKIYIYDIYNK